MTSPRLLVPEQLDALPPGAPEARRARGDLRRINAIMGQGRILAGLVRRHVAGERPRLLEIGAGDGWPAAGLARLLSHILPGARVTLLDRQAATDPAALARIRAAGWEAEVVTEDAFAFLAGPPSRLDPGRFDLVLAGLVLHHFADADLRRLFAGIAAATPAFVAAEPRRDAVSLLASRCVAALGANAVTRHDAPASVRAGFRDRELSALWPAPLSPNGPGWRLEEGRAGPFTHVFSATREVPA